MISVGVRPIREPIWKPLLRIERWLREAAFGAEVVPEVNCMFIMSFGDNGESGITTWLAVLGSKSDMNGVVAFRFEVSNFPFELSTKMRFLKDGTVGDCSIPFLERSGIISFRSVIFSLGGLKARFVSFPMIRWAASR